MLAAFCCGQVAIAQPFGVYGNVSSVFELEYKLSPKLQLDCLHEQVAPYSRLLAVGGECKFPVSVQHTLPVDVLELFKLKQISNFDKSGRLINSISKDVDGDVALHTYSDSFPVSKDGKYEVRSGLVAVMPAVSITDSSNCVFNRKGKVVKKSEGEGYSNFKYGWRGRLKCIEEYGNGELLFSVKYAYHLNGQLKSEFENGVREGHRIYYNRKGLKTKDCRFLNGNVDETLYYEYNADGQFTRQYYVDNGVDVNVFRVEYDTLGRETVFWYRDKDRRVKAYDADGNLTEVLYFNNDSFVSGTVYLYVR